MRVNIQTLQNKKYSLDVKSDDLVSTVKQQISNELQLGNPEDQKIIFQGKILKDDQTLKDAGVGENSSLVIMVSKKKKDVAVPSENPSNNASASAPTVAPPASSIVTSSPPAPVASLPPAVAAPPPAAVTVSDPNEPIILNLMSLGFDRPQVERALRAAQGVPDRAADFLFNGIPPSVAAREQHGSAMSANANTNNTQNPPPPPRAALPVDGDVDIDDGHDIEDLLHNNPQAVQQMLQQIVAQNPQLAEQLQNRGNIEDIMQLLQGGRHRGGGGGGGGGRRRGGRGVHRIEITPEEKQQLDQLEGLGFPPNRCLEAWLSCDRNFEVAAAYLVEHAGDEQQGGAGGGGIFMEVEDDDANEDPDDPNNIDHDDEEDQDADDGYDNPDYAE